MFQTQLNTNKILIIKHKFDGLYKKIPLLFLVKRDLYFNKQSILLRFLGIDLYSKIGLRGL